MRWISTVALQANLQGEDGTGEGANGSEGARTPGGGAHDWWGGTLAYEWGSAHAWGGAHVEGGRALDSQEA
jgi:hypothetical protein